LAKDRVQLQPVGSWAIISFPMDSRTVTKLMDFSAFNTASLRERLGGLRRYL
jgi:hypothetical protein